MVIHSRLPIQAFGLDSISVRAITFLHGFERLQDFAVLIGGSGAKPQFLRRLENFVVFSFVLFSYALDHVVRKMFSYGRRGDRYGEFGHPSQLLLQVWDVFFLEVGFGQMHDGKHVALTFVSFSLSWEPLMFHLSNSCGGSVLVSEKSVTALLQYSSG